MPIAQSATMTLSGQKIEWIVLSVVINLWIVWIVEILARNVIHVKVATTQIIMAVRSVKWKIVQCVRMDHNIVALCAKRISDLRLENVIILDFEYYD